MLQNNFKSSSTTRNRRKLQHAAILSCWRHFCMLRLSKNSFLDDSAQKLLMILHMNFEMFDDSTHKFWRMIYIYIYGNTLQSWVASHKICVTWCSWLKTYSTGVWVQLKHTSSNHIRWAITTFLKEDSSPCVMSGGMAFQSVMVLGQKLYLYMSIDVLIWIIPLTWWFLVIHCWNMTRSGTGKDIYPVRSLWRMFSLWTLYRRAKGGHSKSAKIRVTVPSVLSLFPMMNRAAFLCMPSSFFTSLK